MFRNIPQVLIGLPVFSPCNINNVDTFMNVKFSNVIDILAYSS